MFEDLHFYRHFLPQCSRAAAGMRAVLQSRQVRRRLHLGLQPSSSHKFISERKASIRAVSSTGLSKNSHMHMSSSHLPTILSILLISMLPPACCTHRTQRWCYAFWFGREPALAARRLRRPWFGCICARASFSSCNDLTCIWALLLTCTNLQLYMLNCMLSISHSQENFFARSTLHWSGLRTTLLLWIATQL